MKKPSGLGLYVVAAIALAVVGPAVWAQLPIRPTPPTAPWDLQQSTERCSLTRDFARDGRKMRLRIDSFGEATPYHIILTGDGLPFRKARADAVQIGFGEPEAAKTTLGLFGPTSDGRPMIIIPGLTPHSSMLGWRYIGTMIGIGTPVDPTAETLYVDTADMEPIELQLGPMEDEYARLDKCAQTIADNWAVAATGDARPASEPQLLNPGETNWRTKYPEAPLLNRVSGLVEMRMTIDEQGRARDCVVQASIWAKQFGEDACANFERWRRFEPAKDANGKPVRAQYRTAVAYAIYNWG